MIIEGGSNRKILIVSDFLRLNEVHEKTILFGQPRRLLERSLSQAGVPLWECSWDSICQNTRHVKYFTDITKEERAVYVKQFKDRLAKSEANVIVALGGFALNILTGLDSITKWHLSIVKAKAEYGSRKVIPLLHPYDVQRQYGNSVYIRYGCHKIADEWTTPKTNIPDRDFLLSPSYQDILGFLKEEAPKANALALDVETSLGQINTVGIATSGTKAIAIKTHTYGSALNKDSWQKDPARYYKIWEAIRDCCESEQPKYLQNFIYDDSYLKLYGVHTRNITHDTMKGIKFLHPELEKGLDNVGRLYTPFPYWKDEGKDMNDVRDWSKHLTYNCMDTTGTFWGAEAQIEEMKSKGIYDAYQKLVRRSIEPVREMCHTGLLVDKERKNKIKKNLETKLVSLNKIIQEKAREHQGKELNINSSLQKKQLFKTMGYKVPVQKGKESVDKKAIVKLMKKHPKEELFKCLYETSKIGKQISSYLNFVEWPDGRIRYQLNECGTESGRWSGYGDAWGNGFNPQTVPKKLRTMFKAEDGHKLIQIDLQQAESRYVAWEAPELTLMKLIQDKRDIHKYVASNIFGKPEELIKHDERQLGKKSGHSANYGTGARTFAESCLVEMGISISEKEAKRILASYYTIFPGIQIRQLEIEATLRNTRKLTTPLGRERYFWGRMDGDTYREAYAYCPQSVIPDITNHLIYHLEGHCQLLLQVHDSVLVQVEEGRVNEICDMASDLEAWHPEIYLAGGQLIIPIDIEIGDNWGEME